MLSKETQIQCCGRRKLRRFEVFVAIAALLMVLIGLIWLVHGFQKSHPDKPLVVQTTADAEEIQPAEVTTRIEDLEESGKDEDDDYDSDDAAFVKDLLSAIEESNQQETTLQEFTEAQKVEDQQEVEELSKEDLDAFMLPENIESELLKYYRQQTATDPGVIVENIYFREEANFLEGFYYDQQRGAFYESVGLYSGSKVHKLIIDDVRKTLTIDTNRETTLPDKYFGEGLAPRSATEFALLTYKEKTIFTVDRDTMRINAKTFQIPSRFAEGWGMTADESTINANGFYRMYATDGTYHIYELDGESLQIVRTISVKDPTTGRHVTRLNELEYVDGYLYANVWYKDILLKIDPDSGEIVQRWDLTALMRAERDYQEAEKNGNTLDCLNGIAYDAATGSFYLTGKRYHLVFKVQLQ